MTSCSPRTHRYLRDALLESGMSHVSRIRSVRALRFSLWLLSFHIWFAGHSLAAPDISKLPASARRPVDFIKDIRPIFEANCYKCHGPDKQKGEFRLDVKD